MHSIESVANVTKCYLQWENFMEVMHILLRKAISLVNFIFRVWLKEIIAKKFASIVNCCKKLVKNKDHISNHLDCCQRSR